MIKTFKTLAAGLLAVTALVTPAEAARSPLEEARAQLMRLHIRLQSEAANAPAVIEARKSAGDAYSVAHKFQENVLIELYQRPQYKDLRLALYHTQRKLAGIHEEIPVRIQKLMQGATDALAVRVKITELEYSALSADEAYVEARNAANTLNAAYRQTLRDSLDSIRSNPEFVALSDQVASMQESVTGQRSTTKLGR